MKIVFVLPNMLGGGSERVVALLANDFVNRGYEVAILLFAGNKTVYDLDDRVELVITGKASAGNPLIRLKRLWNMRNFYKHNKNCYIFSFCVMGTVFSVIAAAGIPHRLLVSERNDPTRIKHRNLRDWSYRKAEKLVFQTEDMMICFPEDLQRKSVVIPNPVDQNVPQSFKGIRKKKIVSVARLEPQKNHKLLLDAFAEFIKIYPEYELHIYGAGVLEEKLKNHTDSLEIRNSVIFKGFSPNARNEIADSSMFVLSSDYEGISNSMIEALAMGIPVISTDCPVGGSKTYIQNGINGLLVPVGDKEALTEAMMKLAGNTEFAEKLGKNALKVKEDYRCDKIADRFLEEAGIIEKAGSK